MAQTLKPWNEVQVLRQRPQLRVIISGVVTELHKFVSFFASSHKIREAQRQGARGGGDAPVATMAVQGREYAVQKHYIKVCIWLAVMFAAHAVHA